MNQTQANRLVTLMNIMKTIPNKHFDIGSWIKDGTQEDDVNKEKVIELKCNTTACAVGWAILMSPVWQKAFYFIHNGGLKASLTKPNGDDYWDEFEAIADFLGITLKETNFMFSEEGYEDPNITWHEDQPKVSKTRLLNHCKKVLDTYGYVWG